MTREYEYGFIDGSIILVRNFHAMKRLLSQDKYGQEYLTRSVLQSIFKIAREKLKCDRYIILWDKKPYWKTEFLKEDMGVSEYKADRKQEDKTLIQKLGKSKYFLMSEAPKIGLSQVQIKGWEADDLAYLACKQCEGRPNKSVIISFDSDWISWIGPNTDYYNIKHDEIFTHDYVSRIHPPIKGFDLFESKAYRDSMKGSHNNLKRTIYNKYLKEKSVIMINAFNEGNYEHFEDVDLFKAQLRTFDFSTYPDHDKASTFLEKVVKKGQIGTVDDFRSLREKLGFKPHEFKSGGYVSYSDTLNKNSWNEGTVDI